MEALGVQSDSGEYDDRMADGLQVLRYQQGQGYHNHLDFFEAVDDSFNNIPHEGGSNRFATVFLYMSTPSLGGQTNFPSAGRADALSGHHLMRADASDAEIEGNLSQTLQQGSWEMRMARTCFSGVSVYPRRGEALLFYSQHADGKLDPASLHGGCPVLSGEKWAANLWVWNRARKGGDTNISGTSLQLTFALEDAAVLSAKVFWVPTDGSEEQLTGYLHAGSRSLTTSTWDTHQFKVYVKRLDNTEGLVGDVTANVAEGLNQWVSISGGGLRWHPSAPHDREEM